MKDKLKAIWHDPVWSKVIAGVVLAILGAVYALLKAWASDTETIPDALVAVFGFKVNIWLAAAIVIILLIIVGLIKKNREKTNRKLVPPFVTSFTEGMYQGQRWRWRWQWSEKNNYYYVSELSIVCPVCHDGLLTLVYMNCKCGRCGADIPYSMLKTTSDAVAKQILVDARKDYAYCKEYLGVRPPESDK